MGFPNFKLRQESLCLVGVLTTLRCFYLQLEIYLDYINYHNGKNWFNDLHLNCTPNVDLKDYMKAEILLVKENYQLIKKVKYFEEL